ncbi:MAG TPA: carboxypeptidase-like regulatory domain-containing protein, partial [Silvibacterium sp.]|nr:carboxypeptidase-like regulatory domain-containing protein [Silvibacterium sp.]
MKSAKSTLLSVLHSARARTHVLAIPFCLVALLTFSLMSLAQVLYGTLTGTITDKSGAVVPNANVTLTNQDTGQVRTTTSNGQGDYL